MTSKLTRERLEKIKSWRETYGAGSNVMLPAEEAEALALIALAAMDSEPVAVTDDELNAALQLHRLKVDGHSQLSDAFRAGFRYARRTAPQPAPVVPEALEHLRSIVADPRLLPRRKEWISGQQYSYVLLEEVEAIVDDACRAAMLPAAPACTCPSGDGSLRWPCPVHPGNSPVIPDGYVMVPMRLTAENGAKGALSGEFSETKFVNCPECFGDDECETCDGSGKIEITVPVTWTTIKAIWVKGVQHFAVTAQEND